MHLGLNAGRFWAPELKPFVATTVRIKWNTQGFEKHIVGSP